MSSASKFTYPVKFGLRVFPIKSKDKVPAVKSWKVFAETPATPEQLAKWDASPLNVGVICGKESGIAVLDVDCAEAQALVDSWNLPPTPCVSTGRGRHYYFRHPGFNVSNAVHIAGTKLDIRGDGGYVVGAGSIHRSGATYEWLVSPDDVAFAELPEVVLDQLKPTKSKPRSRKPTRGKWDASWDGSDNGLIPLQHALERIGEASEGKRNNTLFREGVHIASLVAAADADWEAYSMQLRAAALTTGLGDAEVDRTLASCWKEGSENPDPFFPTAMKWAYLSKPNVFYHRASGQMLDIPAFNNTFAHMLEKGRFGDHLLRNNLVQRVHDVVFEPQIDEAVIEKDDLLWLNTYRGSAVEAVKGDASPFEDFMRYLVPVDEEREHLLKMIAWTVRYPGRKLRHALLFRSEGEGLGKTMLTDIWGHILGSHNARKSTTEEITGPWQGFIMNTLLVVVEEINLGAGVRDYNRLKEFITNDVVKVNEKYQPVRNWRNVASFVFLTNLPVPLQIAKEDRRIFFIDTPAVPRNDKYYPTFAAWWQSNLGVIKWYLDTIDLEGFSPNARPPMTAAKEALIANSRPELARDLELEMTLRNGVFQRDIVTFAEIEQQLGRSMFGKNKGKLVDALKEIRAVCFTQQRVGGYWSNGSFVRKPMRASLWAIRNTDYWRASTPHERAEEYARCEGVFSCFADTAIGIDHHRNLSADPPPPIGAADVQPIDADQMAERLNAKAVSLRLGV